MNKLLSQLEEMQIKDLTYIFEYLVTLINYKKEQEKSKQKYSKHKENLITNFQAECLSAQNVET